MNEPVTSTARSRDDGGLTAERHGDLVVAIAILTGVVLWHLPWLLSELVAVLR